MHHFCRALCSYTHPALAEAGALSAAKQPRFASLRDLRRHLEEQSKLQFCAVCLEGRKVPVLTRGIKYTWCIYYRV